MILISQPPYDKELVEINYRCGFIDGARGYGVKDPSGPLDTTLTQAYLMGYIHGKRVNDPKTMTKDCPFYVAEIEGNLYLVEKRMEDNEN